MKSVTRRELLVSSNAVAAGCVFAVERSHAQRLLDEIFLVTSSSADTVEFVNGSNGESESLQVGAAPWRVAVSSTERAFVATAEGVAEHEPTRSFASLQNTVQHLGR